MRHVNDSISLIGQQIQGAGLRYPSAVSQIVSWSTHTQVKG